MPENISRKVVLKMREIEKDPYHHLQKIRNYQLYKFRVENYRGIVDIANKKLILNVVKIKHRNVAYRSLK